MNFYEYNVDAAHQILNNAKTQISPKIYNIIVNWQNNVNNFNVSNIDNFVENKEKTDNYGKFLKGFGGIKESIFAKIANNVNNKNNQELKKLAPTILYYDEQCICLLPANPKNKTLLTANTTSYTLGGESGASSHMHVLVIPRKPIYNAVTLSKKDIPLINHMENVGKTLVCLLAVADSFYKDTNNVITQISLNDVDGGIETNNEVLKSNFDNPFNYKGYIPYGFNLYPESAKLLLGENKEYIKAYFQIHPNNSIGYLHMHIIPIKLVSYAGGNTYFKNCRNIPVEHIISWLQPHIYPMGNNAGLAAVPHPIANSAKTTAEYNIDVSTIFNEQSIQDYNNGKQLFIKDSSSDIQKNFKTNLQNYLDKKYKDFDPVLYINTENANGFTGYEDIHLLFKQEFNNNNNPNKATLENLTNNLGVFFILFKFSSKFILTAWCVYADRDTYFSQRDYILKGTPMLSFNKSYVNTHLNINNEIYTDEVITKYKNHILSQLGIRILGGNLVVKNLKSYTLSHLRSLASQRKIPNRSKMNKEELIRALLKKKKT